MGRLCCCWGLLLAGWLWGLFGLPISLRPLTGGVYCVYELFEGKRVAGTEGVVEMKERERMSDFGVSSQVREEAARFLAAIDKEGEN